MSDQTKRAIGFGGDTLGRDIAAGLGEDGFDVATGLGGAGDADLVVAVLATDVVARDFATLDEGDWIRLAEEPVAEARRIFAGISSLMRAPGGNVLIVLPNIGITGAIPGVAAQSMAAEGIRTMAKAVAKAWRARGIKVNCAILSPAQVIAADAALAAEVVGLAISTCAKGFIASGNSLLIDGENASI